MAHWAQNLRLGPLSDVHLCTLDAVVLGSPFNDLLQCNGRSLVDAVLRNETSPSNQILLSTAYAVDSAMKPTYPLRDLRTGI